MENNLITIISSTIDNIPSMDWENCSININALNKMISIKTFYEEKGNFTSFDPEANGEDITMKSKELRSTMYEDAPDKGAWYSAFLQF